MMAETVFLFNPLLLSSSTGRKLKIVSPPRNFWTKQKKKKSQQLLFVSHLAEGGENIWAGSDVKSTNR